MIQNGTETGRKPSPFEGVTVYHWMVFILAAAGWLFDCMGQRIFILAREPAIRELLGGSAPDSDIKFWGGMATCILMIGWGAGGILFGMISDHYGRVKAMLLTLVAYTVFSGLSGVAGSITTFLLYRFLCGTGVGGMFGAATTLVAESVPARFRTTALGSMQALSATGNIIGAGMSLYFTPGTANFWGHYSGWQVIFFVSTFPIFLAVPILFVLKEPEPWKQAKAEAAKGDKTKAVGSMKDLMTHPRWRKSTAIGICLGLAGMVGLWGIAFFSPELISTAIKAQPLHVVDVKNAQEISKALANPTAPALIHLKSMMNPDAVQKLAAAATTTEESASILVAEFNKIIFNGYLYKADAFSTVSLKKSTTNLVQLVENKKLPSDIVFLNRQLIEALFPSNIAVLQKKIDLLRGRGLMLQDVGALLGMFTFTFVASYFSRRTAFLGAFVLCLFTVSYVFYALKTETDVYWMLPLMGFCTLAVFAGYSIYFPEIFPTRLRGTGIGLCYNTVRFLTAPFPFMLGWLSSIIPFRTVAIIMSLIYLVGIIALIWAPETKGKPLPED